MKTLKLAFISLLLVISGCTLSLSHHQVVSTLSPVMTEPVQSLFTATPDPNLLTINVDITQVHSEEEIAKTLYTKWLDHFLSEHINSEIRLDEYIINKISIPNNQSCAKKLGGEFVAEAEVTAKTSLPLVSTTSGERSQWFVAGGGNIIDSHHLIRLFSGVIYQSENNYTLVVITQIPMC